MRLVMQVSSCLFHRTYYCYGASLNPVPQVGVLGDVITNAENIVAKGRLGPGQMVVADLETGEEGSSLGEWKWE